MLDRYGSILITTLWIMIVLVILAVGVGYRASINLKLAKYQKDRLKAYYLAKAGISKAIAELEQDEADDNTGENNNYDDLDEDWAQEDKKLILGGAKAEYSIRDEQSRININAASADWLTYLLSYNKEDKTFTEDDADAKKIADYILIWRGDLKMSDEIREEAENSNFKFKQTPFAVKSELLILLEYFYKNKDNYSELAQEKYNALREFITVHGVSGIGNKAPMVNVNTITEEDVLRILLTPKAVCAMDLILGNSFKTITDIANIAPKIPDPDCSAFFTNNVVPSLLVKSQIFQVNSIGYAGNIKCKITAVYDRKNNKILHREEN